MRSNSLRKHLKIPEWGCNSQGKMYLDFKRDLGLVGRYSLGKAIYSEYARFHKGV